MKFEANTNRPVPLIKHTNSLIIIQYVIRDKKNYYLKNIQDKIFSIDCTNKKRNEGNR